MSDLVKEMRLALDEVKHDELNDVFADDSDEEMKQAIETAAQLRRIDEHQYGD